MPALYQAWFGLQREPFSIAPDPRLLYLSAQHREALAHLLYGLRGGGGFVLLTGEVGAGKTTLSRCLLEQGPDDCRIAWILNPRQSVEDLMLSICEEFGVPGHGRHAADRGALQPVTVETGAGLVKRCVDALSDFLLQAHARGERCVLMLDEAQNLSAEALEQLRLLTNLETHDAKLLQIVLIGQPELRAVIDAASLRQLAQRIIARFHLEAMSREETMEYVAHRWSACASPQALPFSAATLRRVHALSAGIPRRINLICDRALLAAYAQRSPVVTRTMVRVANDELLGQQRRAASRWRLPVDLPARWQGLAGWVAALAVAAAVAVGVLWVFGGPALLRSVMSAQG